VSYWTKLLLLTVPWTAFSLWYWLMAFMVPPLFLQDGTALGNTLTIVACIAALALWVLMTAYLLRLLGLHRAP